MHFTNTIGRGALDLVVMGLVVGPVNLIGIYGGMVTGGAIGAVAHPIIKGTKDLGEIVLKGYKKLLERKAMN